MRQVGSMRLEKAPEDEFKTILKMMMMVVVVVVMMILEIMKTLRIPHSNCIHLKFQYSSTSLLGHFHLCNNDMFFSIFVLFPLHDVCLLLSSCAKLA